MDAAATCSVCELHAEAVFRVEGMCCREEAVVIEGRLKPLKGIEALTTDLIGQRLLVKYDAALLNTSAIAEAVSATGMRLRLEHEEPVGPGTDAAWRARIMVTWGAVSAAMMFTTGVRGTNAQDLLWSLWNKIDFVFNY